MNKPQKIAIWAGLSILTLMVLFPPWYYDGGSKGSMSLGYASVFSQRVQGYIARIDIPRLSIQIIVTAIIISGVVLVLQKKE